MGGVNDYPEDVTVGTQTGEREDVFFEAGVSRKYQMRRWVAFAIAYNFLKPDSNFDEFHYTDNRVKVGVLFSY